MGAMQRQKKHFLLTAGIDTKNLIIIAESINLKEISVICCWYRSRMNVFHLKPFRWLNSVHYQDNKFKEGD